MEDEELVALALGEPDAGFARMYDTYAGRLYDYCYSILRSADEAGDALQDTFVAALTKLPQLRDPSRLRPWLYAIARNCCFQRSRRRSRERSAEDIELMMPASEDTNRDVESAELQRLVWAAVGGLSDTDRAVIDLNVRHGLEGEDLADALGLTPSRSYVVAHRAKSRLEESVSALLVAKAGTGVCDELRRIVGTDEFTPLIRKRVNRHLRGCEACQETERRNRPGALLALVPFIPLPPELRGKILSRLDAQPPGDGVELGWRSDGFPAPVSAARFGPAVPGAVLAVACVAIILVIGFASLDWLPGVSSDSDDVTAAVGPVTTVEQAAATDPSTTSPTTSDDPATGPETSTTSGTTTSNQSVGDGSPATTEGTTTVPPPDPSVSGVGTPPGDQVFLVDLLAPSVSALEVTCADPFILEVTVSDNLDPDPNADLTATWEDESSPPATLVDQGGGLHQAEVPGSERGGETIVFVVRGSVTDNAGNRTTVELSDSCRFID